ncbi:MAG: hypothetical protein MI924_18180 [Chloroflexales bacterium]|nr:hypothetical protein [Chloroflexales bacterium]
MSGVPMLPALSQDEHSHPRLRSVGLPLSTRIPASVLEAHDVCCRTHDAVREQNVSPILHPGEILVIVRPNGAGKTAGHGDRIDLHSDPLPSYGRACNDPIPQVYRVLVEQNFTNHVLDVHHLSDDRYLPKHFTVVSWEANSRILARLETDTDHDVAVAAGWRPALRQVLVTQAAGRPTDVMELRTYRLVHEDSATTHLAAHTSSGPRASCLFSAGGRAGGEGDALGAFWHYQTERT